MLCDFDIFKKKKSLYHIKKIVTYRPEEKMDDFLIADNGVNEYYVNLKARDGSNNSRLSEYIQNNSGYNKDFPMLSGYVQTLKENGEVKEEMTNKAWEDFKEKCIQHLV